MCLTTTAWDGKAEGVTGREMGEKAVSSKEVGKILRGDDPRAETRME